MKIKHIVVAGSVASSVYAAVCGFMYLTQRKHIYHPNPSMDAPTSDLDVPGAKLKITDHVIPGEKALVYFAGNSSSVGLAKKALQEMFPGRSLYLMNYRGFGGSTGKPTEQNLHSDAAALYEKVRASHSDIAVMGVSLGTGVAIKLASEKEVSRLVLVTPYDSLLAIAIKKMPRIPVKWLLVDKFESWRYAPQVKAPTTLLIAGKDNVVPAWSGEQLATRFSPNVVKVVRFPDDEHHTISKSTLFSMAIAEAIGT